MGLCETNDDGGDMLDKDKTDEIVVGDVHNVEVCTNTLPNIGKLEVPSIVFSMLGHFYTVFGSLISNESSGADNLADVKVLVVCNKGSVVCEHAAEDVIAGTQHYLVSLESWGLVHFWKWNCGFFYTCIRRPLPHIARNGKNRVAWNQTFGWNHELSIINNDMFPTCKRRGSADYYLLQDCVCTCSGIAAKM